MKQNINTQNNNDAGNYETALRYIKFHQEEFSMGGTGKKAIMYVPDDATITRHLELLIPTFTFSDLEQVYDYLSKGKFQGYGTDYVEIHNKDEIITLKHPKQEWINEIKIPTKNFIAMIEGWNKLRSENSSEIYFIQKDDGTFIVRTSLNNINITPQKKDKVYKNEGERKKESESSKFTPASLHETPKFILFNLKKVGEAKLEIYTPSPANKKSELSLLNLIFIGTDLDKISEYLNDYSGSSYESDRFCIQKKLNSITINEPQQPKEKLTIGFETFKKLLDDWKTLTSRPSTRIYIIQKNNGKIIARTTIEKEATPTTPTIVDEDLTKILQFTFDENDRFTMELLFSDKHKTDYNFTLLATVFSESNRWEVYKYLNDPSQISYEDEAIKIYKKDSTVILRHSENKQDKMELTLTLAEDNFLYLMTKWEVLIRKDVPLIYFIQKGSEPVKIQETMDFSKKQPSLIKKATSFFSSFFR